jgi:4-hydroxy-tetrahydrodipicolinate synthase
MSELTGIWAATLTPVDGALQPDASKAVAYYNDLLSAGCDGLNLLGTTGEAMSFGAAQRLHFMEAIAGDGLPMDRVMCGTGAASLEDAVALTRAAFDLKFAAALVMPPFFFRDAGDDGIVRFFDALFARARPPRKCVLLYNFPRMSGITFTPSLVARLIAEFGEAIAGMKDSSNDQALQQKIAAQHPGFAIFPGSEHYLVDAAAYGAVGCISGSVALWPALARDVHRSHDAAQAKTLAAKRASLDGAPFVSAVRYLTAKARGDRSWELPMPPLVPLTEAEKAALDRAVE